MPQGILRGEPLVLAAIRLLRLLAHATQPAPQPAQEPADLLGQPRWLGRWVRQPPLLGVAHHLSISLLGDLLKSMVK